MAGKIYFNHFRDIVVEGRLVSLPGQQGSWRERVNLINNNYSITFIN